MTGNDTLTVKHLPMCIVRETCASGPSQGRRLPNLDLLGPPMGGEG
jgi:hypothetical protein